MAIRVSNVTAQALVVENVIARQVSHTLSFVLFDVPYVEIDAIQHVSHTLSFSQLAWSPSHPHLNHTLNFSQAVTPGIHERTVEQTLRFKQGRVPCVVTPNHLESVSHTLSFTNIAGETFVETLSHNLTLNHEALDIHPTDHTFTLNQAVIVGIEHVITQAFSLSHSIATENIFLRTLTHSTFLDHAFTYYIDKPCNRQTFQQFEGVGQSGTPVPENRLEYKSDFNLSSTQGTKTSVTIRSPEPDDRESLGMNRINRETRGGEINVFSDPIWSQVTTLLVTMTAICDEKPGSISDIQTFLQATLGQEILLQDWQGTSWIGVVTTPNEVATEDRDGYWTFSFEFEGIPYDGPAQDQAFALGHSVGRGGSEWGRVGVDGFTLNHSATYVLIPA